MHLYQRARELTNSVYSLTRSGAFATGDGLSNQIRRACVSIMSNVAEGFEPGTKKEFIQFLYIAKGSCGEVRAQLQIALDQSYMSLQTHGYLVGLARKISGMTSNFIAHLQGSDYRGAKFHHQREEEAISAKCGPSARWRSRLIFVLKRPVALSTLPTLQTFHPIHTLRSLQTPLPLPPLQTLNPLTLLLPGPKPSARLFNIFPFFPSQDYIAP